MEAQPRPGRRGPGQGASPRRSRQPPIARRRPATAGPQPREARRSRTRTLNIFGQRVVRAPRRPASNRPESRARSRHSAHMRVPEWSGMSTRRRMISPSESHFAMPRCPTHAVSAHSHVVFIVREPIPEPTAAPARRPSSHPGRPPNPPATPGPPVDSAPDRHRPPPTRPLPYRSASIRQHLAMAAEPVPPLRRWRDAHDPRCDVGREVLAQFRQARRFPPARRDHDLDAGRGRRTPSRLATRSRSSPYSGELRRRSTPSRSRKRITRAYAELPGRFGLRVAAAARRGPSASSRSSCSASSARRATAAPRVATASCRSSAARPDSSASSPA